MHTDVKLAEIRHKIAVVKEDMNKPCRRHFRHPRHILTILSLREMELEDNLHYLKS